MGAWWPPPHPYSDITQGAPPATDPGSEANRKAIMSMSISSTTPATAGNAISKSQFERNSDDFVFDTQFLVQAVHFGFRLGDIQPGGGDVPRFESGDEGVGVDGAAPTVDLAVSVARKQQVVDRLTKGLEQLLAGRSVTVVPGRGEVLVDMMMEVEELLVV